LRNFVKKKAVPLLVNFVSMKPSILGEENELMRHVGKGDEVRKGLDEGAPCVALDIGGGAPCAPSSSPEELGVRPLPRRRSSGRIIGIRRRCWNYALEAIIKMLLL
jgi:hypothetical protein